MNLNLGSEIAKTVVDDLYCTTLRQIYYIWLNMLAASVVRFCVQPAVLPSGDWNGISIVMLGVYRPYRVAPQIKRYHRLHFTFLVVIIECMMVLQIF